MATVAFRCSKYKVGIVVVPVIPAQIRRIKVQDKPELHYKSPSHKKGRKKNPKKMNSGKMDFVKRNLGPHLKLRLLCM